MNTKIKFGTDGWRGVIADDFTFANVRRVAQATADYWNAQPLPKKTIVGYDNRFFSEVYARLVSEVLAVARSMPSKSVRMSPRCETDTPVWPTSPRAIAWSAS